MFLHLDLLLVHNKLSINFGKQMNKKENVGLKVETLNIIQ